MEPNGNNQDERNVPRGVVSDAETSSPRDEADDPEAQREGDDDSHAREEHEETSQVQNQVEDVRSSDHPDAGNLEEPQEQIDSNAAVYQQHPPLQWPVHPPPPGPQMLQFYEAQMRDHAAAYASAAAGAAWAAWKIAADMASCNGPTMNPNTHIPRALPVPPQLFPMPPVMPYPPPQPPPQFYEPSPYIGVHPPPDLMPQPYYYDAQTGPGSSVGGASEDSGYGHHRRKRQQRMPPDSGASYPHNRHHQQSQSRQPQQYAYSPSTNVTGSSPEKRGRRRRFRNDGSSDNGSEGPQYNINNNHNRRRTRKMAASSSSDGGSATPFKKKKSRQPSDESLLGKTGVSALYEWCGKRRTTPNFALKSEEGEEQEEEGKRVRTLVQDFEITVSVDGMEWGRGRGRTKSSAKQEAARRALQALLPGVVFDEASGILVQLPSGSIMPASGRTEQAPWNAAASLEDLAPNLAKRLAIGQNDEEDDETECKQKSTESSKVGKDSKKRQKLPHVYPGTSTTSDEEDENAYYASRGASVCSALLHAMVQIDERIPEAPSYSYQVSTVSPNDRSHSQLKRKAGGPLVPNPPIVVHRGSFTCTATMKLRKKELLRDSNSPSYEILQAEGVGGTKREARHTASAKLLALLFPNCAGMVQVKQAAEAAREKYAASKALKQQSKRERTFTSKCHGSLPSDERPNIFSFAMASSKTPAIPPEIEMHFMAAVSHSCVSNVEKSTIPVQDESGLARQLSRQKQLDDHVASALQKLNEHDEEGRSLPDEVTVDDVGRTVLRRASQEDMDWIAKLLDAENSLSPVSVLGPSKDVAISDGSRETEQSSKVLRLWSSSTLVLLLCRAIAPYDDPPLGCAVLTLGFSMEKGRLLRIAQIGSKPHLPRERFIECLQSFATCLGCSLETSFSTKSNFVTLRRCEIFDILKSHLPKYAVPVDEFDERSSTESRINQVIPRDRNEPLVASPLQSVQEESEGNEESDAYTEMSAEKRLAKEQDKPSKRSRVN